jgi:DNA-binding Xre family transcriptional regulator
MSYTIKGKYFPDHYTLIKDIHKKYGSWAEIERQTGVSVRKFGAKTQRHQPMRWHLYRPLWLNYYNENISFPPLHHLIKQLLQIYRLKDITEITGIIPQTLSLIRKQQQQTTYYENYLKIYQLYEENKGDILALPVSTYSPIISTKRLIKFSERKGFPPPSFLIKKIKKDKGGSYRKLANSIEISRCVVMRIVLNGCESVSCKTYVKLLKGANIKSPFPNLSLHMLLDFLCEKHGSIEGVARNLKLNNSNIRNWHLRDYQASNISYFKYLYLYFTYQAHHDESSKKERT